MLTAETLRSRYLYDPETGLFTTCRRIGSRGRPAGGRILGYTHEGGYVWIRIDGHLYRAHRLAWLYMTGEWPSEEIDHRDLNKSNNSWKNLRECTHQQNMMNCKIRKHNKLGIKGVLFHAQTKKYRARITVEGKSISLGLFQTKQLAGEAYRVASDKYHGKFGRLS